ncbi:MAG: hypothetical protein KDC35_00070 [Acidobacteria bacterium]|nr:hypothetical protein [Acidobacteriota bacterium]
MKGGAFAVIKVIEPKAQYWGRLIEISPAGVIFRGIEVTMIERYKYQIGKDDCEVFPETLFVPSRRLLCIALDENQGTVPSVIDSIRSYTGLHDDEIMGPNTHI